MILSVFVTVTALFTFGAVLIAAAHRRSHTLPTTSHQDWLKFAVYFMIVNGFVAAALWSTLAIPVILCVILVAAGIELHRNLNCCVSHSGAVTLLLLIAIVICLGHCCLEPVDRWQSGFVLAFLLTCLTDAFSQLWGKLVGRTKLCPTISPGKTVEGLAGGLITAVIGAFLLSDLTRQGGLPSLVTLGIAVGLSATAGDLAFSLIKRRLGVKDFSAVLPGHGGVLDRFDSFILAAPAFYWTQRMLSN